MGVKMPIERERVIPVFDKKALDEKAARIDSMKDKFIRLSNTEQDRIETLDVSDENTALIKSEKNKRQLIGKVFELLKNTEVVVIPQMKFLHEMLNSLVTVDWLNDTEIQKIKEFNVLTEQMILEADNVNLMDVISNDNDSIFTQTEKLSQKVTGDDFPAYLQALTMMSAIMSDLTLIKMHHEQKMIEFVTEQTEKLKQEPYNYQTSITTSLDHYTIQPLQTTVRYNLFYNDILEYIKRAIKPNAQADEAKAVLASVEQAHELCKGQAKKTNEIRGEYEKHNPSQTIIAKEANTQSKSTNYAPMIASVTIGVALGVGLAFGLLALGVFPPIGLGVLALTIITASYYGVIGGVLGTVFPKLFKKDEPTTGAQNTKPMIEDAPKRKRVNVTSISVGLPSSQPPIEPVEPRIKPLRNTAAFFEPIQRTDSDEKKRRSSGIGSSPENKATQDHSVSNEPIIEGAESPKVTVGVK